MLSVKRIHYFPAILTTANFTFGAIFDRCYFCRQKVSAVALAIKIFIFFTFSAT